MSGLAETVLIRTPGLTLLDVRCGGGGRGPGAEEATALPEIVLTRAGLYRLHSGGVTVVADANQALFFNPGDPYRVSHPAGGDRSTVLRLGPALLEAALAVADPGREARPRPFRRVQSPVDAGVDLLHRRLARAAADGGADPLGIEEATLALAVRLLAIGRAAAGDDRLIRMRPSRRRELVAEAQEQLAARLDAPLELTALAAALRCSPWHLSRLFRRETGLTLSRYRLRLRLRLALERLAGGAPDLTALALDLGFSDHAHFTRSFSAELGVPPSALRPPPSSPELRRLAGALGPAPARKGVQARELALA